MDDKAVKDYPQFLETYDGSSLRIAIVHSRWNKSVIDALIAGAKRRLMHYKVKEENIIVQSVPGSFELPLACQRYASRVTPNQPLPHPLIIVLVE